MGILAGKAYDPAAVATITTAALNPMEVFDATNLRLTFTVPSNGSVLVRGRGVDNGNTTYPQFLIGILQSTTVIKRVAPKTRLATTAPNTTLLHWWATFVVTGLTPAASLTWDLARSVEAQIGFHAIRWGGPNNGTTADDAYGAICFEIWDTD